MGCAKGRELAIIALAARKRELGLELGEGWVIGLVLGHLRQGATGRLNIPGGQLGHANPGQPGIARTLWLRLKLIADVGLVGLPNAGKSTFLAATSNARPKIADYPFTTLVPNLGVVGVDGTEFVVADIPGLIEGAHEGRGLGQQFLGHVERCAVLLHLVDATAEDIVQDHQTIVHELEMYAADLAAKPRVTVLNKSDALSKEQLAQKRTFLAETLGKPVLTMSGVTQNGVLEVLRALRTHIDQAQRADTRKEDAAPWSPV